MNLGGAKAVIVGILMLLVGFGFLATAVLDFLLIMRVSFLCINTRLEEID